MRKRLRALLVLASAVGLAGVLPPAAQRLAHLEFFRVKAVVLEGEHHLTQADAEATASVPVNASVWDDPADWEARLAQHPLVREVHVRRKLPSTLVFVISEREPVALLSTPTLVPVDAEGHVLPLDPSALALDLPLLEAPPRGVKEDTRQTTGRDARREGDATSMDVALLAREAEHLSTIDPEFAGSISDLARDSRGDIIARFNDGSVTFRFRAQVPARRLAEGRRALAHRPPEQGAAVEVDLRFADQIVVRQIR